MLYALGGTGGLSATGATAITAFEATPTPEPGIVVFRDLPAGRYHLSDPGAGSGSGIVSIYCSDYTSRTPDGGPMLAQFKGPATVGILATRLYPQRHWQSSLIPRLA